MRMLSALFYSLIRDFIDQMGLSIKIKYIDVWRSISRIYFFFRPLTYILGPSLPTFGIVRHRNVFLFIRFD